MAEFPGFMIWTDAYLADTTHLTTIEHGAFFLLLLAAWRSKTYNLPDDDRLLARYAHLTPSQWRRVRGTLAPLWRIGNGKWSNDRLLDELNAVRRQRDRRSNAGRANALKRWNRDHADGNATAMPRNAPQIKTKKEGKELVGNTEPKIEDSVLNVSIAHFEEKMSDENKTPDALNLSQEFLCKALTVESLESHFEAWWKSYPRRVGKKDAKPKYVAIVRLGEATPEQLQAGLERYKHDKPPRQDWCYPATWLNGGRWMDREAPTEHDQAQALLEKLRAKNERSVPD